MPVWEYTVFHVAFQSERGEVVAKAMPPVGDICTGELCWQQRHPGWGLQTWAVELSDGCARLGSERASCCERGREGRHHLSHPYYQAV